MDYIPRMRQMPLTFNDYRTKYGKIVKYMIRTQRVTQNGIFKSVTGMPLLSATKIPVDLVEPILEML